MNKIKSFLFFEFSTHPLFSTTMLWLRLLLGGMLMTHGLQKLSNYEALAAGGFPDPIGLGSALSVTLAIGAESGCSIAVILGLLHRAACLPIVFTLLVAFGITHGGSVTEGELAAVYLTAFVALAVLGPGRFSVDGVLSRRISH